MKETNILKGGPPTFFLDLGKRKNAAGDQVGHVCMKSDDVDSNPSLGLTKTQQVSSVSVSSNHKMETLGLKL